MLAGVALAVLASLAGASRPALAEFTFEVVKSFELLPVEPSELVTGPDGALYGTSQAGLRQNGTIFRIDSTGTLTILHVFDTRAEGYPSRNALTLGSEGALYGTTGSAYGGGTIFKIDSSGAFTVVHSFAGHEASGGTCGRLAPGMGGALFAICLGGGGTGTLIRIDAQDQFSLLHTFVWGDGYPQPSLTAGSDGFLYGTTGRFVFRVDGAGTVTPIYYLAVADGAPEKSALTLGSDGALYGTTTSGSCSSCPFPFGTVFRVDSAGNFSRVHAFSGEDGFSPGALTLGSDGALYGTTLYGGTTYAGGWGYGTVFRIDSAGNFASLHSFDSSDGLPGVLTLGRDGALYGIAARSVSVFRIDTVGTFTTLHSFAGTDYLRQPLALGGNGALYGTTECCYTGHLGSVFEIDTEGNVTSLRSFSIPADGSVPAAPLVVGTEGALYGTTLAGGSADSGTVFRVDGAGAFQSLASLPFRYDGPAAELVVGGNGILYGSLSLPSGGGCASGEGGPSPGSVFAVDSSGSYSVVHAFDCSAPMPGRLTIGTDGAIWGTASSQSVESATVFRIDSEGAFASASVFAGIRPSSLTLGPDGALYGTNPGTYYESADGGGIFRVDDTLEPRLVHSFDRVERGAEGYDPVGPLSLGNDGGLYGATGAGGSAGLGTLFRIDAAGSFSLLHSFAETDGGSGINPLVAGADGAMYGTTARGGSSDLGTVFRVDAAGVFTLLHSFSGTDGADPQAALVLGSDGALYGPTQRGGSSDDGTIFRVDPSGGVESVHSFTGGDGANPFTALIRGSDDALFGTTPAGGPGGGGVVYRLPEPSAAALEISGGLAVALLAWRRARRS